jgi:hypothetical protein
MKVRRFATQLEHSLVGVLVLAGFFSAQTPALHQTSMLMSPRHDPAPDQKKQADVFGRLVRESTERFRDVSQPN